MLKRLIPLVLSLSFLIGCAPCVTRYSDSGWIRDYENGKCVEMVEDENGDKTYFCRVPIRNTGYSVEVVGPNRHIVEIRATNLSDYYFYGVGYSLLSMVDKNNNFIIEGGEIEEFSHLRRYFYKEIKN